MLQYGRFTSEDKTSSSNTPPLRQVHYPSTPHYPLTGFGPFPYRLVNNQMQRGSLLAQSLKEQQPAAAPQPFIFVRPQLPQKKTELINLPALTPMHSALNAWLQLIEYAINNRNSVLVQKYIYDTEKYIGTLKSMLINIEEQMQIFDKLVDRAKALGFYR